MLDEAEVKIYQNRNKCISLLYFQNYLFIYLVLAAFFRIYVKNLGNKKKKFFKLHLSHKHKNII